MRRIPAAPSPPPETRSAHVGSRREVIASDSALAAKGRPSFRRPTPEAAREYLPERLVDHVHGRIPATGRQSPQWTPATAWIGRE